MLRHLVGPALLVAFCLCGNSDAAPTYRLTNLGALAPVSGSYGIAINNSGTVGGGGLFAGDGNRLTAILWDGGVAHKIGTPGSIVGGLNSAGTAVGAAFDFSAQVDTAVVWNSSGQTTLGTLGGQGAAAESINDAGIVVGRSAASDGWGKATRWDNGVASALPTLGGVYGGALDINSKGQIVGSVESADHSTGQAVMWDGDEIIPLSALGGLRGASFAINDVGHAVGFGTLADGAFRAALWNESGVVELGMLDGGHSAQAYDINNLGQIIGSGTIDAQHTPTSTHAVLWQGTTAIDLNTLLDSASAVGGWVLSNANSINDVGQITGTAFNVYTNQYHAYLLTPVPEPATWAAMLLGLTMLGANSIRRSKLTQGQGSQGSNV